MLPGRPSGLRLLSLVFLSCAVSAFRVAAQPRPDVPAIILPDIRLEQLPKPPLAPPTAEIPIPETPTSRAPAGAEKVRFAFFGLEIEGNTAYPDAVLARIYAAEVGTETTLARVYQMADAIQRLYREDGYFLSRVIVPAQTVRDGKLRVRIIEGYISEVLLEGDVGPVESLLQGYMDRVTAERPLRLATLERALLLANDVPGITVTGVLRASASELGAAELVVTSSRKSFDGFGIIDNLGDSYTGTWEFAGGVGANSFSRLGERIGLIGLISDPWSSNNEKVGQGTASWRIGSGGLAFETLASYGRSNPGSDIEQFNFANRELLVSNAASYPVVRGRNFSLWGRSGFDFINADTDVFGDEKYSRDRLRVWFASLKTDVRDGWRGYTVVEGAVHQGLPVLNATRQGDSDKSRADGTGVASLVRGNVTRLQGLFYDFTLFGQVAAQYAFDELLSEQEFTLGGTAFGRGYDYGELSGDNGVGAQVELQYTRKIKDWYVRNVQLFGFYDYGQVWQGGSDDAEAGSLQFDGSLSSAGGGVRTNAWDIVSLELLVAKPLTRKSLRANDTRDPQVLFRMIGRF